MLPSLACCHPLDDLTLLVLHACIVRLCCRVPFCCCISYHPRVLLAMQRRVTIPFLVVHGEADTVTDPEIRSAFISQILLLRVRVSAIYL